MASQNFMTFLQLLISNKITSETLGSSTAESLSSLLGKTVSIVSEPKSSAADLIGRYGDGMQGYEEEMYKVLFIESDNLYIRIDGVFDSYGSEEWTGIPYEVFPKPVEQVIYVKEGESTESPAFSGKLEFAQILAALRLKGYDNSRISELEYDYDAEDILGPVEKVEDWGGEDEGSKIGRVFLFKNHDVYLRIDGYYQSHYGSDWDNDPYEVKPAQKQVTVFQAVK